MELSFDHYNQLEQVDLFLCNPDDRELFPINATNRKFALRFNDLSELTFDCSSVISKADGTNVANPAYPYLQTRRRVNVPQIGRFIITEVKEEDDGATKQKSVTCQSLQAVFKDIGFYCEERVYKLYNPEDPKDEYYDASDTAAVPSVVGQLYQQLGIQINIQQGMQNPSTPYDDWTISYINADAMTQARSFKEETTDAYEFMVKSLADAFEVCVLFDFQYRAIHIVTPSDVNQKANVIFSFSNFMKDVVVNENSDDIVTVLDCTGDNCNITTVNPTGTNYICDFSYYMDGNGQWMSNDLQECLADWKEDCDDEKETYEGHVAALQEKYEELTAVQTLQSTVSSIYTDLLQASTEKASDAALSGIIWAETVNTGENSRDSESDYYDGSDPFTIDSTITAYVNQPEYQKGQDNVWRWVFSGAYKTGTAEECFAATTEDHNQYLYFADSTNPKSYCKLQGTIKNNALEVLQPTGNLVYNKNTEYYRRNETAIDALCLKFNTISDGNVQYELRPFITRSKMRKTYPSFSGDIATTYTFAFDIADSRGDAWCVDLTSIDQDGNVIDYDDLEEYANDGLGGFGRTAEALLERDTRNLICHYIQGSYDEHADEWEEYYKQVNQIKQAHLLLAQPALVAELNRDSSTSGTIYTCSGFKRYADISFANKWMTLYDAEKASLVTREYDIENNIESIKNDLFQISDRLNILHWFVYNEHETLIKELRSYWIEGSYTNDNIAVTESTKFEDAIALANELMETGAIELSKICQPKYTFSIESTDCLKLAEFKDQMKELVLGRVITVEKEEGLWYTPALLEMEFNLDKDDSFSMTFANALRLDDWGFTYGDLISTSSSTSKQVAANWQNFTAYSKDKPEISSITNNPLDETLRSETGNSTNQEFKVTADGILGRKFADEGSDTVFSDEQIRMTNNQLLFTDNGWNSIKTALGKIKYLDEQGNEQTAYGLSAEVLVGALLMGNKLLIKNTTGTFTIDENGIKINNGTDDVFKATTAGNVSLTGKIDAKEGSIAGFTINTASPGSGESNQLYIDTHTDSGETPCTMFIGNYGISYQDKASQAWDLFRIDHKLRAEDGTNAHNEISAEWRDVVQAANNLSSILSRLSALEGAAGIQQS